MSKMELPDMDTFMVMMAEFAIKHGLTIGELCGLSEKKMFDMQNDGKRFDIGLCDGAETLWKNQGGVDFTIKVEQHEIKVHKVVLMAVSRYFNEMLQKETNTDSIQITSFKASVINKVIELVYTGNQQIFVKHSLGILDCAVHFQMDKIVVECVRRLKEKLSVKNCQSILLKFKSHSFTDATQTVKEFIKQNRKSVIEQYGTATMSYELLVILVDAWDQPEWGLFVFVKDWINADLENRSKHMNDILEKVKYQVLTLAELESITEDALYTLPGCKLAETVRKAMTYQDNISIYKQVFDSLNDERQPSKPFVPVVFGVGTKNPDSVLVLSSTNGKEADSKWKEQSIPGAPNLNDVIIAIVLKGFLVLCTGGCPDCDGGYPEQKWNIFDVTAGIWYEMAGMKSPKTGFTLVEYGAMLYALGGSRYSLNASSTRRISDEIEVYSFETNTWVVSNMKLPERIGHHAACVLNDNIYVQGGTRLTQNGKVEVSKALDCLNMKTKEWSKKKPNSHPDKDHLLSVMYIETEKAIIDVSRDFFITYYSPRLNSWFQFDSVWPEDDGIKCQYRWEPATRAISHGNTTYVINISEYEALIQYRGQVCMRLDISLEDEILGPPGHRTRMLPCPIKPKDKCRKIMAVMLPLA